jgi:CRISPR/Cas system-associated exonuclease Cas4 (RecB family)
LGPEYPLRKQYPELGIYLAGTADLILMDTTGELIIVDYKTNNAPKKKDLVLDTNGMVSNVQMAAYITMAENQLKTTVGRASFYSIEQRSSIKVIDPAGPPKTNSVLPVKRADYEPVLTALNNTLTDIVQYLTTGQYPVAAPANRSVCTDCPVKAVCRINFSGGEKA